MLHKYLCCLQNDFVDKVSFSGQTSAVPIPPVIK